MRNSGESKGQHIVLATYGTLGDVFPYLQLGITLKARGHQVTVATSELYSTQVEAHGLTFVPIRPDWTASGLPLEEFGRRLMDATNGAAYLYREFLIPNLRDSYVDLLEITREADLLVTHPLLLAAPLVADKTGIRWISTVLAPISFLSTYDPSVFAVNQFPDPHWLHPSVNRFFLKGIKRAFRAWTAPIDQFRAELNLLPRPNPMFEGQHAPSRVLALFSPVFAAPQPDWPQQACATGFVFYQSASSISLPTQLSDFLEAGSAPIVFTLGSSAVFTSGRFFVESLAAIRQLGCRAVFLTGGFPHLGLDEARADPTVLVVDYVPHQLLFERSAIIVHQGGIGTMAQALRSGRPMLVVPHGHDQPDNATRALRLGAGRLLPAKQYTAKRAVAELTTLLQHPPYQLRATQLREQLMAEDGTQTACNLIEAELHVTA